MPEFMPKKESPIYQQRCERRKYYKIYGAEAEIMTVRLFRAHPVGVKYRKSEAGFRHTFAAHYLERPFKIISLQKAAVVYIHAEEVNPQRGGERNEDIVHKALPLWLKFVYAS